MGSTQEAVLPVGHLFAGRYRIRRFLGEGDRKRTYLADDTVFLREVALALIKHDAALSDPEGTRREVEALALAVLLRRLLDEYVSRPEPGHL